jgi:hypothetical protein
MVIDGWLSKVALSGTLRESHMSGVIQMGRQIAAAA